MSTDRGVKRREELLAATLRVIVRDGPGAVTLRTVTDEAKASHGSVAYYFGSRDELITEALVVTAARNIEALAESWREVDAAGSDVTAVAAAVARHSMRQMIEQSDMGITIVELHLAASRDPQLRPILRSWGRSYARIYTPTLRALGSCDPNRDAAILTSCISGLVMTQLALPRRKFESEVLTPAIARVLHGLG